MDPLSALLDAPRAQGAFLLRVTMEPPWAVRVQDEAPLSIVAVTSGSAYYVPDGGVPVLLHAGDLLLVARSDPYLFADAPDRRPQAVIHPGGRCETPSDAHLELPTQRGVRTWGNAADGRDVMLVGTYPAVTEVGSRLLRALPPYWVVRASDHRLDLVDVLAGEIRTESVGQASMLDRLLDGLTVAAIRHWVNSPEAASPGWLSAATDPVVGAALDAIHDRPASAWTVGSLAHHVGLSRAAFARRFTDDVGEPPIAYLTAWRMALAADRLAHHDASVARVAADVGYANPFTFSAAFKRHFGRSPSDWRRRAEHAAAGSVRT